MPNVTDALAALLEAYEDTKRTLPPALQPLNPNETLWTETLIPVKAA
jgi:antitoxin HicB